MVQKDGVGLEQNHVNIYAKTKIWCWVGDRSLMQLHKSTSTFVEMAVSLALDWLVLF